MAGYSSGATDQNRNIRRAFVSVGSKKVHYRACGSGPAIVLLHDSPRSSRLHTPTMLGLANSFTVFALDTPGYGNSDPLGIEQPEIGDFADALDQALGALGLRDVPLYATHTSAKIALDYSARYSGPPRLILDGLSIPTSPTPPDFIAAYMRPFVKDDDGAFIAKEWIRVRDMLRWFPWFNPDASKRMQLEVSPDWIRDYTLDLFAAGPHYSDAYAAAMRYDPKPALLGVTTPTVVGAKSDDVLFDSLQRVPTDKNSNLETAPLSADREEWLAWLIKELGQSANESISSAKSSSTFDDDHVYVDVNDGQIFARQYGDAAAPKVLVLDTPFLVQGQQWAEALKQDYRIILPDLPGFGESDALNSILPESFARAINSLLTELSDTPVAVLATGYAAPLAILLAHKYPQKVRQLIIDGGASQKSFPEASELDELVPYFEFSHAGSHLHETWHMLRDCQASWPWHDRSNNAHRKIEPKFEHPYLYDSFMGVLKQPAHYGDAVRASFSAAADLPVPTQDILFLELENDPAFCDLRSLSDKWPAARTTSRAADISNSADVVLNFLSTESQT